MSDDDRTRWNARYSAGAYGERTNPCALLEHWVTQWPPPAPDARALDLACGAGRNSIYLAGQGYRVNAVDISAAALARGAERAQAQSHSKKGLSINWQEQDLDAPRLEAGYSLIIVVRYADLKLVQRLPQLLLPGGRLLVEAHLGGPLFTSRQDERDANGDRVIGGPGSERFRLAPGSLSAACLSQADVSGAMAGTAPDINPDANSGVSAGVKMKVLHSQEALINDPDGRLMALAQFVGERVA